MVGAANPPDVAVTTAANIDTAASTDGAGYVASAVGLTSFDTNPGNSIRHAAGGVLEVTDFNDRHTEFTITAAPGFILNPTSLTFDSNRGGPAGTRGYEIYAGVEGAPTIDDLVLKVVDEPGTRDNPEARMVDLSGPGFQGVTSITFRYFPLTSAAGSTIEFNAMALNGNVVPLDDPFASSGGPYTVQLGSFLSLDASASLPSFGEDITAIKWDLNNNDNFSDATGATPAPISSPDLQNLWGMSLGENTIQLRVTDTAAKNTTVATTVTLVPVTAPVVNPGFEDPVLPDAGYQAGPPPGWNAYNDGIIGVLNPTTADLDGEAPEGENIGLTSSTTNEDGFAQILTSTFQADANYVLTAMVGNTLVNTNFPGYRVQLLAGGTILAEDDNSQIITKGAVATSTVSYTYDAADAGMVGQALEIRLLSKGLVAGEEVAFDDVRLTVALANPAADPGGPYTVSVGGLLSLDGSGSQPSDGQILTTWEWDLNNDGIFDDATGATPSAISYEDLQTTYGMTVGPNPIQLRVTDDSAKSSTAEGIVILSPPIACQVGVLDLDNANGGINPNTEEPWAVGDTYRLAFTTSANPFDPEGLNVARDHSSSDINDYNDFVQLVASNSSSYPKLGLGAWKVIGSTAAIDARDNTRTNPTTDDPDLPIFLADGTTLMSSGNADLWSGANATGESFPAFLTPYFDENGDMIPGTSTPSGPIATGTNVDGTSAGDRVLGGSSESPPRITNGQVYPNAGGRWLVQFNTTATNTLPYYALSDPLTVVDLTDETPPTLVSIADNVSGGPVTFPNGVVYTVTFDKPMSAGTINAGDFENSAGATATINIVGVNATADPAVFEVIVSPENTGTIELQIAAGAELLDLVGNPLNTTTAITDDTTIIVKADTVAPVADTFSPANGSTDIPLSPTLVITFIEESEMVIGTGNIELRNAVGDTALETIDVTGPNVTLTGPLEATITLSSQLPFGTTVYVHIDNGAFEDTSANPFAGISDSGTWSFTTVALPTPDGPMSIFTAPAAGELVTDADLVHAFGGFPRLSADHVPVNANDIELSAGHHLVIYSSRFDAVSGGNRSEIQTKLNLNGVDLAAGWSQGYIRRLGPFETITAGGAIINVETAGDILQLQSFRTDTNLAAEVARADSATNSTSAYGDSGPPPGPEGTTGIQLLKLDDTWDYLRLEGHDGTGTDQALPDGSGTQATVVYNQVLESDAAFGFTAGTGDVTLNQAGRYLVFANTFANGSGFGFREQVTQSLALSGIEVPGSKTTVYLRDADGAFRGAASIGMVIATTTTDETLNVRIEKEGGTTGGVIEGARTALTIVKLPESAEIVRLNDDTGQDINAEGSLNYGNQVEVAPVFAHDTGVNPNQIGVNAAGDYLFLASHYVPSGDASNNRRFGNQGWQVNGSGGLAPYGQTGRYNRHTGASNTAGNWSGFMTGLAASDFVETLTRPIGDGGSDSAVLALQGVNIDSLFGETPPPPASPYNDWAGGFAGLTNPDPTLDFDGGGLATGLEWVLGGDPTNSGDDASIVPTFDNTSDPDFFIFTFRRADDAAADANTTIKVEYGSDLVGWTEAVAGVDIEISVDDNGAGVGIDLVEVKIRRTLAVGDKLFARLNVVVAD